MEQSQKPHLNKTDVKCRFFALYWMQDVKTSEKHQKKGLKPLQINNHSLQYVDSDSFLELKPLSKITDEDLKNIADIGFNFNQKVTHFKVETKAVFGYYIMPSESKYVRLDVPHIDYLRSKGYALPFMEYSVDELVELGWVRLV